MTGARKKIAGKKTKRWQALTLGRGKKRTLGKVCNEPVLRERKVQKKKRASHCSKGAALQPPIRGHRE